MSRTKLLFVERATMEDTRAAGDELESRRCEARLGHASKAEHAWVARGRYAAFGVSWAIQADDISAYHLLLDRLPPGSVPVSTKTTVRSYAFRTLPPSAPGDDISYLLLADGKPLVRSSEPSDVAEAFEENLSLLVAEHSQRRVFVHAGVVGWRDRAIVIAGGPRTGKSTLVRALVACGAIYYSDDYAVLDGSTVQPYRSRLPEWIGEGGTLSYLLDEIRGVQPIKPLPVGIVLLAPYQPGAVFKPKLMSRGKFLLGLFKHAVAAQRRPEQVLRVLDALTRKCNALEGPRGDANGVATYLLDRLV
jgi:hypothetical protein